MHTFLFVLIFGFLSVSCIKREDPKATSVTNAPEKWQNSISEEQSDDLSSALEGITDSMIMLQLAGEKIEIKIKVEKYVYQEGIDDAIEIQFSRSKHLDKPAYLDVRLHGSEILLNKIGFSSTKVSFNKGETDSFLLIPVVDNDQVEEDEKLRATFEVPGFISIDTEAIDFSIIDNDIADISEMSDIDLAASQENIFTIKNQEITLKKRGNPQYSDQGILFNGSKDGISILRDNAVQKVYSKTLAISLETSDDISRRQIIFDDGGDSSGLNIYLDRKKLYVITHSIDSNRQVNRVVKQVFMSQEIRENSQYNLIVNIDRSQNQVHAWLNGHYYSKKFINSQGFRPSSRIGLGMISGKARFHDGLSKKSSYFFKGSISRLTSFDKPLNEKQLLSLRKSFRFTTNFVFVHQSKDVVAENEQLPVTIEIHMKDAIDEDLILYTQASGTATIDKDFTIPKEIIIPKGQSRASFQVKVLNDNVSEFKETLIISIKGNNKIPVLSRVSLDIIDDEGLDLVDKNAPWVSFNSEGPEFHTERKLWIAKSDFKQPSYARKGNGYYAKFDGKSILKFKYPIVSRYKTHRIQQQTIALLIKSPSDTQSRQVIYQQGDKLRGINIYIDKGFLFFHAYNPNKNTHKDGWQGHTLMGGIESDKYYNLIFSFDTDKHKISAYINDSFIENPVARVEAIPQSNRSAITFGGADNQVFFHDGSTASAEGSFKGGIYEVIFYNRSLDKPELNRLSTYLRGRYIESKLAGIQ